MEGLKAAVYCRILAAAAATQVSKSVAIGNNKSKEHFVIEGNDRICDWVKIVLGNQTDIARFNVTRDEVLWD